MAPSVVFHQYLLLLSEIRTTQKGLNLESKELTQILSNLEKFLTFFSYIDHCLSVTL